ncbi:MAG: 5'/3'-nucleotidase SurE [Vicingaceae bacterium]|nr:5'/3'-nucleotidase SurE [Vicingaceae bacterium]
MHTEKPLILVVNDDGITAPGIKALLAVVKSFGDAVIVAPDKPQSGMGHAITINSTLHVTQTNVDGNLAYACSGTPVDCVKIAINKLLPRKPDLIVSGINHGSNSSINVIYSGTMSAAVEGSLEGVPSIGFSLLDHSIDANFTSASIYAKKIIKSVLEHNSNKNLCLNVNFPNLKEELINGIKVCRQAKGNWQEDYDERTDPFGRTYYWLTGKFVVEEDGSDTDEWALDNGYISVVPVQSDVTNYKIIDTLNYLENV